MSLFAIGDLHFGFSVNKPMDIFGEKWIGHSEKIIASWEDLVSEEDTVLLPGDISWAMRENDAKADLDVIKALPGKKILLEGNHDYWWSSAGKLERKYQMRFLKNDCEPYEDIYICGTRGWLCPDYERFTSRDKKLYEREQIRLRLSLDSAVKKGGGEILLMMHFPPANDFKTGSAFMDIIKEYPVKQVVYGHIHGDESHKKAVKGEHEGIMFHLVSSDYLDFTPKRII